jgi:hypothetical protein
VIIQREPRGEMARFYPNTQSASVPESERRVFEGLKRLSDDWIVVHGLRFIAPARGKVPPHNGEADFVLVHPRQGLIVLEAKGGSYEVDHGTWYTYPGGDRTPMERSPFAQATQNRYDLADHIYDKTGIRGLPFGHAVAFTDGAPRGELGPAAPRAIVVDGTELADLPAAVRRIYAHWFTATTRGLSEHDFEQVLSVLAPTATISADKRYSVDVTLVDVRQLTEREIQFTSEQLAVIAATEPGAFVSVLGAAGTGKTIIASRRAAQLAGKGLRVVFIADQRYLHGALLNQPSLRHPNIVLGTPDEVLRKLSPELSSVIPGHALWEAFMEAAESNAGVDAVIIDEAQSYDDDLLEALRMLSPASCQMYADPYQRDASGMWRPPGSPRTFWLTRNCRNSLPIAKLVARLSGSLTPHDGASGTPIRFLEAEADHQAFRGQFASVVTELLRVLEPPEVAILTCAHDPSDLRKVLAAHQVKVALRPGDDGVTLLSAREFRGCEAPAVVLVAGPGHECKSDEAATNHYVAVSRAVADLTVLGNADDWSQYRFLMETR